MHAFIDGSTGDVYQTLPWDYRGWHCGTGTSGQSANNTHIGIEMCEPACIAYTGGTSFTFVCTDLPAAKAVAKRTYETAVELFAVLCRRYGLGPFGGRCDPFSYGRVFPRCREQSQRSRASVESAWHGIYDGWFPNGCTSGRRKGRCCCRFAAGIFAAWKLMKSYAPIRVKNRLCTAYMR